MRKGDLRKLLSNFVVDENLVSDKDIEHSLEIRRLEWQEKEKEQETQLCMEKLVIKEYEISEQLKAKELKLATATARPPSATKTFDVTRHVRFVPPFQEAKPDKYFLHFEKIATSLHWLTEVWTLLLQSKLVGKAWEVYSALFVDRALFTGQLRMLF